MLLKKKKDSKEEEGRDEKESRDRAIIQYESFVEKKEQFIRKRLKREGNKEKQSVNNKGGGKCDTKGNRAAYHQICQ